MSTFWSSWLPHLLSSLTASSDGQPWPADSLQDALAGASAVASGNSPSAMNAMNSLMLSRQYKNDLANRTMRQQELNSELQSAALNHTRTQQEISAFRTPEQEAQAKLDYEAKLAQLKQQTAEPELIPMPQADGTISYMQRKYNAATGNYDISPAMATMTKSLSSPTNVQPPYAPDATVNESTTAPLSSVNPEVFKANLEFAKQKALQTDPDIFNQKLALSKAEGASRANTEAAIARGGMAALRNVPPHLVPAATAASDKAGAEYAAAKSTSDRLGAMMDAADKGNVLSYQLIPEEGTLQVFTPKGCIAFPVLNSSNTQAAIDKVPSPN